MQSKTRIKQLKGSVSFFYSEAVKGVTGTHLLSFLTGGSLQRYVRNHQHRERRVPAQGEKKNHKKKTVERKNENVRKKKERKKSLGKEESESAHSR